MLHAPDSCHSEEIGRPSRRGHRPSKLGNEPPGGVHAASARPRLANEVPAEDNRPTISRLTRCTVPLPMPTIAATFKIPCPALRCSRMAYLTFWPTVGRPDVPLFALCPFA